MKTSEIRSTFLDYFRSKGHTIVPSSSLVPSSDPTLLFTNSGMVQFKNVFLGSEKPGYVRAADVQRCLRAGGKHNDLDAVGYTARHHTFFEMLGNWSFGDYFKRDAIHFAWELLTGVFKLPAEKLWVTVYHTDDEAFDIWHTQIGVPAERIVRIGDNKGAPFASDNFWQMADTGPCGPCTEIFFDHGADIAGGPPGSPDEDGDRYIEIWNLVFMQFDRAPDGTLSPLPAPCVDTGMGLERLAAVLQHVHSNYEIDLFAHLIAEAGKFTGTTDLGNKSLRVIADHIRACAFLIVDGVLPSNEGRGYVLRRIIRRALRHGWMLGVRGDFFWKMVQPLVEEMGEAYPELAARQSFVEDALRTEEQRFGETLEQGMTIFDRAVFDERALAYALQSQSGVLEREPKVGNVRPDGLISFPGGALVIEVKKSDHPDTLVSGVKQAHNGILEVQKREGATSAVNGLVMVVASSREIAATLRSRAVKAATIDPRVTIKVIAEDELPNAGTINGGVAFRLYDTYGFPVDLTADIARERGLEVDMDGFDKAMNEQRERARAAGRFEAKGLMPADLASQLKPTVFLGYDAMYSDASKVVGIVRDGKQVSELADGEEGLLILDRTPFYAESGGQVGDTGELITTAGRLEVRDTLKMGGVFFGHAGRWHGAQPLRTGEVVEASVNALRRQSIVLNHSATHLLHAALRKVLGDHVTQKGSLVAAERLRFDFSHFKPMSREELAAVEAMVNAEVRRNAEAEIHNMAYDEAIEFGAMALFGEKYGAEVRVLKMGDFSTELCGGTHVSRTGDIGLFKIVSEAGVASGVRRIEAVTGDGALAYVADEERRLGELSHLLSSSGDDAVEKLRQIFDRQKKLERELESLRSKSAGSAIADLAVTAQDVDGIKVVAARLEGLDAKSLRDGVDQLKQQLGDCVVLLAGAADGRVSLIAGVHGKALGRIKAGDIVAHIASQIGGKGGGRPDMAQGGGADAPGLPKLLAELPQWISSH